MNGQHKLKIKKVVMLDLKICLIWFLFFTCLKLFLYGIPLIGLPNQDDILCARITNMSTKEMVLVKDAEELKRARNAANLLTFKLGAAEKQDPKIEIVYELKDHTKVSVSANEKTVYFKDKAFPVKGGNGGYFIAVVDVCFFWEH